MFYPVLKNIDCMVLEERIGGDCIERQDRFTRLCIGEGA